MKNQQQVLKHLRTVEQATLDDIYMNCSMYYHCNAMKHVGNIMSRLVKSGLVIGVKNGVFKINPEPKGRAKLMTTDHTIQDQDSREELRLLIQKVGIMERSIMGMESKINEIHQLLIKE